MRLFAGLLAPLLLIAQPYDLVISGARLVDGTGSPWFLADLAVSGDRIARITPAGLLRDAPATRRIQAQGLVLAPGFIDIQGHSREYLLDGDSRVIAKVSQGVTTEILGEGNTNAPANEKTSPQMPGSAMSRDRRIRFAGAHGFDEWLRAMQTRGTSINFGSFVGAGTLRQYVKGMAEGRLMPAEQEEMRRVVRLAMEDGAFGIASALIYPPDSYQSTDELVEACKAMAPFGGVYITHMRSEADQLIEGTVEAIEIGRRAGVPVEIYHLKAAGIGNWRKEPMMIAKIDSARAAGLDVQANMYPYTAGGTGLAACLPPFASADGKLFANLSDDAARARIRAEVARPTSFWESLCEQAGPQGVLVSGLRKPENQKWTGRRLGEIMAGTGTDWLETVMNLLRSEQRDIGTMYFLMNEDNVRLQLKQPWMKFGTDAGGSDPDSTRALVHPRSYGTYPRILGRYVRDEGIIPLEDAIRKMTSAVAERLLIADRGLLRPGMYADVVVFDPQRIKENSTYEVPLQLSTGMHAVLINGIQVVRDDRHTGAKPGRIVRGAGWQPTSP